MSLNPNTGELEELCTDSVVRISSPEILFAIFKFLDVRSKGRVAQVCRAWRDVVYIPHVWKNVLVHRLSPASLIEVYRRRGIHRIQAPVRLPNTDSIEEWQRRVDDFVSHSHSSGVTDVTISIGCSCTLNNFTPDSLVTLLRSSTSTLITSLNLTECSCVSNSFFILIAEECPNLTDLVLLNTLFREGFYNTLDGQTVWTALGELRKLRFFALLGWNINDDFFHYLVSTSVGTVAESTATGNKIRRYAPTNQLPLTHLALKNCDHITDASLGYISQTMPDLLELNLDESNGITYDGMKYLSALKKLRALSLPCLRPAMGRGIKMPSITDDNGENYNDIGVTTLRTSGVLGQLEMLLVVGITDKSMDVIALHTRRSGTVTGRLVELHLCCVGVTDQGLMLLVNDSSTASSLRGLSLFQCRNVTGDVIGRLAMSDQLANLRDLNLTSCSQLDDTALDSIADGFPSS